MAKTYINSWEDLYDIGTDASSRAGHYVLNVDLDSDSTGYSTYNSGTGWNLCPQNSPFTGIFDGNGHTISDLTSNASVRYRGLFGQARTALIKNVTLLGVSITGDDRIGALVGEAIGCEIINCHATGSIAGDWYTGGLLGFVGRYVDGEDIINSVITNCSANVSVSGTSRVGGFVGQADYSEISYCSATGSVNGTSQVGGFAGYFEINTNNVIDNCFATGNITGAAEGTYIGGFVGPSNASTIIRNSYARGNVSGGISYVAGFAGRHQGAQTTDKCYSTGTVTAEAGATFVGGFSGRSSAGVSVTNSFYESDAGTGKNTMGSAYGTAKTPAQMQDIATFTDEATAGLTEAWDFVGTPNDDEGTDDYWDIDDSYPFLTDYPIEEEDAIYNPFESRVFSSARFISGRVR